MANSGVEAGHNTILKIALDPVGSPGTRTRVAQVSSNVDFPKLNRKETEVTAEENTIDAWITGVLSRDAFQWTVNYIYDEATHIALQGLMVSNLTFGLELQGPPYPGSVTPAGIWIMSGVLTAWQVKNPIRVGQRTADVMFRASGPMIINGVLIGADVA